MELLEDVIVEKWSTKYKKTIDCSNPRGFSQKAHCAARKKRRAVQTREIKVRTTFPFLKKVSYIFIVQGLITRNKII